MPIVLVVDRAEPPDQPRLGLPGLFERSFFRRAARDAADVGNADARGRGVHQRGPRPDADAPVRRAAHARRIGDASSPGNPAVGLRSIVTGAGHRRAAGAPSSRDGKFGMLREARRAASRTPTDSCDETFSPAECEPPTIATLYRFARSGRPCASRDQQDRRNDHARKRDARRAADRSLRQPDRRVGFARRHRQGDAAREADGRRLRDADAPEQAARAHVHVVRVGQAEGSASVRVLRERREGDDLGPDQRPLHARVLRRAHGERAEPVVRLRTRAAGPAHAPAALRPGHRQVRRGRMGRRVPRDRREAAHARPEVRHLLLVRQGEPRVELPVRAVRSHVRPQQPARTARTCVTRRRRSG